MAFDLAPSLKPFLPKSDDKKPSTETEKNVFFHIYGSIKETKGFPGMEDRIKKNISIFNKNSSDIDVLVPPPNVWCAPMRRTKKPLINRSCENDNVDVVFSLPYNSNHMYELYIATHLPLLD